jgi:hypothetical protein
VDGLKEDIKSVILVQCPVDLDTACTLTLLQEEATVDRCKEFKQSEFTFKPRGAAVTMPLPLPLPPPRPDLSLGAGQSERRGAAHLAPTSPTSSDSKVATLRAYCRARGLCQFCAEKWARGVAWTQQISQTDYQSVL